MKIVFLHIPKTAGNSVISGLKSAFGARKISPIRSHAQASDSCFEGWSKYDVFAGHLDWADLEEYPGPKFVFSILREPRERVASFYFYLLREAEKLSEEQLRRPENTGKRAILTTSPDDYFLGGSDRWQGFIRDHYDNFYCSYFAHRTFRPNVRHNNLSQGERLAQARVGQAALDFIGTTDDLPRLEDLLSTASQKRVTFAKRYVNVGPLPKSQPRWHALLERLETNKAVSRLEAFTALDTELFNEASGKQ